MVEPSECEARFDEWFERHDQPGQPSFEALCSAHPTCAALFQKRWKDYQRLNVGLDSGPLASAPSERPSSWTDFLAQLRQLGPPTDRYRRGPELDHGGMGTIHHVEDPLLRRQMVVKVLRSLNVQERGSTPGADDRSLGRFLEEAQVTARLDHPYIVPVHDLGVDAAGQVYFAMKRVRGQDLRKIFEKIAHGAEKWSVTRGLQVMLKVCDAMAYAHARGVLHRDLKPGNVMVGRYGEVYVMDWGLARILDQADTKDVRIRLDSTATLLKSERKSRHGNLEESPETPLITMDGDVVGTPAYMPLEQAEGNLDAMGPRSDVYAVGAILYHLLAGTPPYVERGEHVAGRVVLERVKARPPAALQTLAPRAPLELVAIIEKAMARLPRDRYSDMAALAADMQAYLEKRVVSVYESGLVAESKKWVQRNRSLAIAAIMLVLISIVGTLLLLRKNSELTSANTRIRDSELQARSQSSLLLDANGQLERQTSELAEKGTELERMTKLLNNEVLTKVLGKAAVEATLRELEKGQALLEQKEAQTKALNAELETQARGMAKLIQMLENKERELKQTNAELTVERDQSYARSHLLGAEILRELIRSEATLLPAHPDRLQEMLDWISQAAVVSQLAPKIDASIAMLEDRALSPSATPADSAATPGTARHFPTESDRYLQRALIQLRADLARFEAGPKLRVERSYAWARTVTQSTLHHPGAKSTWSEARVAILAANGITASTAYRNIMIDLEPQIGLVPIGMNPVTKLWEFYDLRSASALDRSIDPDQLAIPTHAPDGSLQVDDSTGIVFVLLPGGTYLQGAQSIDPSSDNFDPDAQPDELPVPVVLAPLFISRYEITRAQWSRLIADVELPVQAAEVGEAEPSRSGTLPIATIDWRAADFVLRSHGLRLPTEAQWEYAARGGTSTPWWTGTDSASLTGAANILGNDAPLDARVDKTLAVGSLRANPFGLHDVHGNVWEWCADEYTTDLLAPRPLDGLRGTESTRDTDRVIRGGAFTLGSASSARSANRSRNPATTPLPTIGLRAARNLTD